MKGKILNTLLLVSSLYGFLEWGSDKSMFLFQIEAELFSKIPKEPLSVIHPLVLLPILGQVLLLVTLIKRNPAKRLTYLGITGIGLLMALIFLVGCLSLNPKILLSSFPFLAIGYFTIQYTRKLSVE